MGRLFLSSLNKEHSKGEGYHRIYFSYPSNMTDVNMKNITSILFDEVKFDTYYCDYNKNKDISKDDMRESIKEMDLLIISVDKSYFPISDINQMEIEIAREEEVPILPVLRDDEYINFFNDTFKHIQCLREKDRDFAEKLEKYLKITFNDTLSFDKGEIEKIFPSPIFISYRKKDIEEVRQLLENLHEEDELKSYQFWYDDFLNPGNNYDKEILEAIEASNTIIILITENTFEEGNYVKVVEYPFAVKNKKNIIAIKVEGINDKRIKSDFPKVEKIYETTDIEEIKKYILKHSKPIDIYSSKKQFLLGQAYFHGVVVERNYINAYEFLKQAAESGERRAYKYLAILDYEGLAGNSDIRSAVFYQKKHLEECCSKGKDEIEYYNENLLLCRYYLAFYRGTDACDAYYSCMLDVEQCDDILMRLEYRFIEVESNLLESNYSTTQLDTIKEIKNIIKMNFTANSDDYYMYMMRANSLFAQLAIGLENYEFAVNALKEYEKSSLENIAYAKGSIEYSAKACYLLAYALEKLGEKSRALNAYQNMFVFASFDHGVKLSHYFSIGLFKSTELDEKSSPIDIRKSWYYERQSAVSFAESDRARYDYLYAYYLSMYDDNIFDLLKALYLYERYSCYSALTFVPERISLYERILQYFVEHPDFSLDEDLDITAFDYRAIQYILQKKDIALICLSREIYLRTLVDENETIIEEKTGQLVNVVLSLGIEDYDFQTLTDDYTKENIDFFEDDEDEEEHYYLSEDYLGLEDTDLLYEGEEEF